MNTYRKYYLRVRWIVIILHHYPNIIFKPLCLYTPVEICSGLFSFSSKSLHSTESWQRMPADRLIENVPSALQRGYSGTAFCFSSFIFAHFFLLLWADLLLLLNPVAALDSHDVGGGIAGTLCVEVTRFPADIAAGLGSLNLRSVTAGTLCVEVTRFPADTTAGLGSLASRGSTAGALWVEVTRFPADITAGLVLKALIVCRSFSPYRWRIDTKARVESNVDNRCKIKKKISRTQ